MIKQSKKWTYVLSGLAVLLGAFAGQLFKNNFSSAYFIGALPIAVILITINIVKVNKQKTNIPETDERFFENLYKFHAFLTLGFIAVSLIALAILSNMAFHSINITVLWAVLFAHMIISGIGTIVIKNVI